MKKLTFSFFLFVMVFFLVGCELPDIALVPEEHGNILHGNITADKVITVSNQEGTLTCSGKYQLTKNPSGCIGKEGGINFKCSDGSIIEAKAKSTSCETAEGVALDSSGIKFNMYIDKKEIIAKKIHEFNQSQKP